MGSWTPRSLSALTNTDGLVLPSTTGTVSALRKSAISSLISPAHALRYRRFAHPLAGTDARLAAKVARYTFLSAGLAPAVHARVSLAHPRTLPPAAPALQPRVELHGECLRLLEVKLPGEQALPHRGRCPQRSAPGMDILLRTTRSHHVHHEPRLGNRQSSRSLKGTPWVIMDLKWYQTMPVRTKGIKQGCCRYTKQPRLPLLPLGNHSWQPCGRVAPGDLPACHGQFQRRRNP